MVEYNNILNIIIENGRKIFYPEEWLALDFQFSKTELFTMLLVDRQGEITMTQISDYINVPMSTATGIVERLVKNGHLKRERSELDRRIVTIRLTDKGREIVEELKNKMLKYVRLVNERLTDEERQVLVGIFTKIMDVFDTEHTYEENSNEDNSIRKIEIE